jgi:anti-anti-sigma factor
MEIKRNRGDGYLELCVEGRLDAYWADHLTAALDESVRQGADHIRLDMIGVVYMSSVGIRVLLRFHTQLRKLNGSFSVVNPSPAVKSVLELAGLESILLTSAAPAAARAGHESATGERLERDGVAFEVHSLAPGAAMAVRLIGAPAILERGGDAGQDCHTLRADASTFAVGLGALGGDYDDCRGRFGEFIAAGGAAAYLPADGTNVADSLVAAGAFVPELRVLYAIACEGTFAHLVRFEAVEPEGGGARPAPVALDSLVRAALDLAHTDSAAFALIAESAGLMGAALRRSPAAAGASFGFDLPRVRDWLWFTPERAFARSTTLIVGVATRGAPGPLAPFLRPVGDGLLGHFHAAAFTYHPLRKGRIDLRATVAALFDGQNLESVLHLLRDDRPIVGGGQSELGRGACWIAPLGAVGEEA